MSCSSVGPKGTKTPSNTASLQNQEATYDLFRGQIKKLRPQNRRREEPQENKPRDYRVSNLPVLRKAHHSALLQIEEDLAHESGTVDGALRYGFKYLLHVVLEIGQVGLDGARVCHPSSVDFTGLLLAEH